jgi:hypothetical protein
MLRSVTIPVTFAATAAGKQLSKKERRAFSNALLNDPVKKFHQVHTSFFQNSKIFFIRLS